jgi:hypothetical protein
VAVGIDERERGPLDHVVQFYECEDELAGSVAAFLVEGLQRGESVVVVATPAHRRAFEERLVAAGIDPRAAEAAGSLVLLDARQTLDRLLVDGRPRWSGASCGA